jgi:hypothetical protein
MEITSTKKISYHKTMISYSKGAIKESKKEEM